MIVEVQTSFDIPSGKEITDKFEIPEESVKQIVTNLFNRLTYSERKEYLETLKAIKQS